MACTTDRTIERGADAAASPTARHRGRHVLAATVAAQPLLIAVNGALHPEVDMEAASLFAGAAASASSWYAVHLVAAIGALLGAPAAFGLRSLLSQRSRLGDVALVTAVPAAIVLALAFMAEASVLRLAVVADMDGAAALALTEAYLRTPEFYAVGVGVLAASLAAVLFGVGLLLERRVPIWMPGVTLAGTVLALGTRPGSPQASVAFGIVAVAAVGLARRVAAGPR